MQQVAAQAEAVKRKCDSHPDPLSLSPGSIPRRLPVKPFRHREVDHLIALELGGSNSIRNLWPEAALPKPGFHEKDKVENYLHRRVCAGRMTLRVAQRKMARNWLAVYRSAS
jgi:hypothetical protein